MLFPMYLAAMGLSAGIVGVFGRRLLATSGYVPNFDAGVAAALMIACVYMILQSIYGGLIQLIKPHKGKGPHLTEILSLLSAVVLIPYLLNLNIPWPHPKLAAIEPMLFFAAFIGIHGFLKLSTLFAATQAPPAFPLLRIVPYLLVTGLAFWGAQYGFDTWYKSLTGGRTGTLSAIEPIRIGDTYAQARPLSEGLQYDIDVAVKENEHLTLRWANPAEDAKAVETLHLHCTFYGSDPNTPLGLWNGTVAIQDSEWTTQRIPDDSIPSGTERMDLVWNLEEESEWVRQTGLRPTHTSGATILLSGPFRHHAPSAFERPNIVLILVEGLGADHMELFGYERQTTPQLTTLAKRSSVWESTFTACPDTFSTAATVLTGVSPLLHGSIDTTHNPLPANLETLPERMRDTGYATVAFTEGEGSDGNDLVYGSGFERGFELFNPAYQETTAKKKEDAPAPLVPVGARDTLKRAADWIGNHREDERYLVFIRLRELRKPFALKRYGKGFIKPWEKIPRPLDVYDTALLDVDKQLGLFLERIREMGSFEDTCIVITSPYGLDFSEPERGVWRRGGPGIARLTEESIRVPLIISMPEGIGRTRRGLVSLNALGRTLSDFAGVSVSQTTQVRSLLDYSSGEDPVTVMGNPLAVSLRTRDWRYNWQSGRAADTLATTGTATTLGLSNIADYHETGQNKNFVSREPAIAGRYRKQLSDYLDRFVPLVSQAKSQ